MMIFKNIPAAQKILTSLVPLQGIKHRIESAHARGDLEAEKAAILDASKTWGDYLVRQFKANVEVEGRENLPQPGEGPVVYVVNHQGYADVPVLCSVLDTVQFGFLAKDVLKQIPVYGAWMNRVRSVMIKREDARASLHAIAKAIGFIEEGSSMLVFPEGTRSWGGPMNEFKPGAFKLATKPKVPIIPISICGTYTAFEEPGYFRNGQTVKLIIHEPIPTEGLTRAEEKALVAQVQGIIADGVARLREEMDLPEHTAEEVANMKQRIDIDKMQAQAIKQAEKMGMKREKEAVKTETRVAKEIMKNETKAAKAEAKAAMAEAKELERQAKEAADARSKEAKVAAREAAAKAREEAEARIKEAKETADFNVSMAVLEAKYIDDDDTIEDVVLTDTGSTVPAPPKPVDPKEDPDADYTEDLDEKLAEELTPETADLPHPVKSAEEEDEAEADAAADAKKEAAPAEEAAGDAAEAAGDTAEEGGEDE